MNGKNEFCDKDIISCVNCRECMPVCPMKIRIPDIFKCLNDKISNESSDAALCYKDITRGGVLASDCLYCSRCMKHCPEKLDIPKLLIKAARMFE